MLECSSGLANCASYPSGKEAKIYHSSAAPDPNGHVEAHGGLLGDTKGEQTFGRPYRAANALVIVVLGGSTEEQTVG